MVVAICFLCHTALSACRTNTSSRLTGLSTKGTLGCDESTPPSDSQRDQLSFDDFLRIAKGALSGSLGATSAAYDLAAQAKMAETTVAARSINNMEKSIVVSDVGSFWGTSAGAKAIAKTRPPPVPGAEPYRPKQKGDTLSFVGEPVPESLLPPEMFPMDGPEEGKDPGQMLSGSQSLPSPMLEGQTGNMANSNSKSSNALGSPPTNGSYSPSGYMRSSPPGSEGEGGAFKVTDWNGGNVLAGSGAPGDGMHGADLQRLSADELDAVAAGSGINAARAAALQRRDANERLRTNERPRDFDINGSERSMPVRGKERVRSRDKLRSPVGESGSPAMVDTSVVSSVQGEGNGEALGATGRMFECMPPIVDLGEVELESTNTCEVVLKNAGKFAARFRVRNGLCSTVIERPKGPVAAGMKVPLRLRCIPKDVGHLNDVVEIVTEHEQLQIAIVADVRHKPTRLLGSNAIH